MLKRILFSSAVAVALLFAPPVHAQKSSVNYVPGGYNTGSTLGYSVGDEISVTVSGTTSVYQSLVYQAPGSVQPLSSSAWLNLGAGGSGGGASPWVGVGGPTYTTGAIVTLSGCAYYSNAGGNFNNTPGPSSTYWTQLGDCVGAAAAVQATATAAQTSATAAGTAAAAAQTTATAANTAAAAAQSTGNTAQTSATAASTAAAAAQSTATAAGTAAAAAQSTGNAAQTSATAAGTAAAAAQSTANSATTAAAAAQSTANTAQTSATTANTAAAAAQSTANAAASATAAETTARASLATSLGAASTKGVTGTGTTVPTLDSATNVPGQVMQPTVDGGEIVHQLTSSDIPSGLSQTSVIAEFPLNNISGTSAPDITTNGHNATLSGSPSVGTNGGLTFSGTAAQGLSYTDSASWPTVKAMEIVYSENVPGGTIASPGPTAPGAYTCFLCSTTAELTGTFTYVSGASSCTNGTQTVAFSGGATSAAGTITVSGGVPTGNVTLTSGGAGYSTLPTTATVNTCTGTATLSGGTLYSGKIEFISLLLGSGLNSLYTGPTTASASGAGTHVVIIWTDGTYDHIAIDGFEAPYVAQGNAFANFTNPSLAGAPFTFGYSPLFGVASYMAGTLHYVRFLSAIPSVVQDTAALTQIVSRRGVSFGQRSNTMLLTDASSGDSRTAGTGTNISYATYTNTYLNNPYQNVVINGDPGFTAATMKYYPVGREAFVSSVNAQQNDATLWEGTNDLFSSALASVTWTNIQQHAAALRGVGFRHVFLITEPDRGSSSAVGQPIGGVYTYASGASSCTNGTQVVTFSGGGGSAAAGTITVTGGVPTGAVSLTNTGTLYTTAPTAGTIATCTGTATFSGGLLTEQALNQLERANWQQSFDALIDIGTNNQLAPNASNSGNTTYYQADHTHFTVGGYTTVAQYKAKAINAFYGSKASACDPVTVTTTPYAMQDADGCKIFDTQAGASVVNFESALGITGRVVRVCNLPSGTGAALTLNVATQTPIANTSGVVATASIPIAEYFNYSGNTSATVPVNTCHEYKSTAQSLLSGGSFWQQLF